MSGESTAQTAMTLAVDQVRKELVSEQAKRMSALLRDKVALQKQLDAITKEMRDLDRALNEQLQSFAAAAAAE